MIVQQHLILLIAQAKVLQELVGQAHKLLHQHIVLLVIGILQQIEHNRVHAHIAQQALFVLAWPDNGT